MQSSKVHSWIKSYDSSILFVNGNHDGSARISPLSFVSAKLLDSMRPASLEHPDVARNVLAHGFFCGRHLDSRDPDTGLTGTLKSLIAQLLISDITFDLSLIERLRDIDLSDVDARMSPQP